MTIQLSVKKKAAKPPIDFGAGDVVLSLFDALNGARHLNVTVKPNNFFFNATGILGQTNIPEKFRSPNEHFRL